jgi:hypothetical protein
MFKKVARNQPCPCGSGKKYKHCHGTINPPRTNEHFPQVQKLIKTILARAEARRSEIERQHGMGRPPIALRHLGRQIVGVGSTLFWSKKWKTFPDFLMDFFKNCVGETWWKEQVARRVENRHPLYHWYVLTCEYQRKMIRTPGEITEHPTIVAAQGVLWFAYGLYLLRHNVEIQKRLLQRLLSDDEVQVYGALYEVYVAARVRNH